MLVGQGSCCSYGVGGRAGVCNDSAICLFSLAPCTRTQGYGSHRTLFSELLHAAEIAPPPHSQVLRHLSLSCSTILSSYHPPSYRPPSKCLPCTLRTLTAFQPFRSVLELLPFRQSGLIYFPNWLTFDVVYCYFCFRSPILQPYSINLESSRTVPLINLTCVPQSLIIVSQPFGFHSL